MTIHFQREIANLKKMILTLAAIVEESVRRAVTSIEERDRTLAEQVITRDSEIDQREMQVEEECLKILALYQPVAVDLRYVVAVLKINNDLERIGDLAVNIAERTVFLAGRADTGIPFAFGEICHRALDMVRDALDALMNLDLAKAQGVLASDDEVDAINRQMYGRIAEAIRANPDKTETLMSYQSATRSLERIADSATNIAEDVIYLIQGEIVRHGKAIR
ncbi:MAG: phosphate signaling complex protein PhoU [Candidatus Eisenbacteria bacterium]